MPGRKRGKVEIKLRLYPGHDDELIRWLEQLDEQPYGAKTRAIKEALRMGLGAGPVQVAVVAPVVDLAEVRRVVEAGVTSALERFEGQVIGSPRTAQDEEEDDEVEGLLDVLHKSLVLRDEGGGSSE